MLRPKFAPPFPKTTLSLSQARAWGMDHPIGYAYGGAAYGQYLSSGFWGGIGDTFSSAGNAITTAARDVGNFVSSAARETGNFFSTAAREVGNAFSTFDREVLQPVGHAVEKVGQGIANDPITFIAQAAAIITQQYWALPLIAAASTAAHGGSFEQILTNTAISAAMAYVGGNAGDWIANGLAADLAPITGINECGMALAGSPISATTANIIAQVGTGAGMAAVSAVGAAAQGKDPLQSAITTLIPSLVGVGLNQVSGFSELSQSISGATDPIGKAIQNTVIGTLGGVAKTLVAGGDVALNVINSTLSGTINGLMSTKNIITDSLSEIGDKIGIGNFSDGVQSLIAGVTSQTLSYALTGGKAGGNLGAALAGVTQKGMSELLATSGNFLSSAVDTVNGLYDKAQSFLTSYESTSDTRDKIIEQRDAAAEQANKLVEAQQDAIDEFNAGKITYDQLASRVNTLNSQYQAAYGTYKTYADQADAKLSQVNGKATVVNAAGDKVEAAAASANEAARNQQSYVQEYDRQIAEYNWRLGLYNDGNSNNFAGTFNAGWYLQQNPDVAAAGMDAYQHFLQYGYNEGRAPYPDYNGNLDAQAAHLRDVAAAANSAAQNSQNWATEYNNRVATYNTYNSQYQTVLGEYNTLKGQFDALQTKANSAAGTAESYVNQINNLYTQLDNKKTELDGISNKINEYKTTYDNLIPKIENFDTQITQTEDKLNTYSDQYYKTTQELDKAAQPLTDTVNQYTGTLTQRIAEAIDPTFNADEYKQINGLGPGIDPYQHYVTTGKDLGLMTNMQSAQAAIDDRYSTIIRDFASQQGYTSVMQMKPEMVADLRDKLYSQYGNNLAALNEATVDSIVTDSGLKVTDYLPSASPSVTEQALSKNLIDKALAPGWYQPSSKVFTMPDGMKFASQMDVAKAMSGESNNIYQSYDKSGKLVYLVKDPSYTPVAKYDAATGEIKPTASVLNDMVTMQSMDDVTKAKFLATMTADTTKYLDQQLKSDAASQGAAVATKIVDFISSNLDNGTLKDTALSLVSSLGSAASMPGSFMESFGVLTNALTNIGTYVDVVGIKNAGVELQSWGKSVEAVATAARSTEAKAGASEWDAAMKQASGVLDSVQNFTTQLANNGAEFMSGFVTKEVGEELIQQAFAVGGGAVGAGLGFVAGGPGGALAGATVGYRSVSAIGSFFENYQGGNDEVKARTYEALIAKGYSASDADTISRVYGGIAGFTQGAISGGIDFVMSKSIPNTILSQFLDSDTALGKILTTPVKSAIANMVSGLPEGGLQSATSEALVYSVDPSKANFASAVTQGAMFESLVGGPTAGIVTSMSGGMAVGMDVIKMALTGNVQFQKDIESSGTSLASLGQVINSWLPPASDSGYESIRNALVPVILEDNPQFAEQYSNANDFITAVQNSLGVWEVAPLTQAANKYFDSQVTTPTEAAVILANHGLTGATVTDAVNSGLVGVSPNSPTTITTPTTSTTGGTTTTPTVPSTGTNVQIGTGTTVNVPTTVPTTVNTTADTYVNKNMVTAAELQRIAAQENYTLTQTELDSLVGRGVEADVIQKFIQEIDPKAVTTAEATQYFRDLGYTKATAADIAQFVKSSPEAEVQAAVASWVDPKQVTRNEAINYFAQIGYVPTEAEINQYVVQGPEVVQSNIQKQLTEYVDPRYVDAQEVRDAFKALGLEAPVSASDIARLSGQYAESELAGKAKEGLPVVSSNAVYSLLAGNSIASQQVKDQILARIDEYKNLGLDQAAAQQAATQAVAAQLGTTKTDLLSALGATEQNLMAEISGTKTELLDKIEQYKAQGLSSDQAIQAAVDTVASNLGTTRSELLTQLGTTETGLKTYVSQQVSATEAKLADLIAKNENAGMQRDQATQAAIDELSGQLGTTRTDLLSKIDLTSQQFQNEISVAKTDLDKQITLYGQQTQQQIADTKTQIQQQMSAYEQAGIDRDTALGLAISGVAQDLGTTKNDLLTKLNTSEANLRTELTQQTTALSTQVQDVAKLLGKPVSQVTANDITMVKNMIAGQTQTNLAYDINQDGKIDIKDQTALETQLAIQNNPNIKTQVDPNTGLNILVDTSTGKMVDVWQPAAGTPWAPTGVYEELKKQQEEAANVTKTQTATTKTATQKNQFGQLMNMLFQAPDVTGQQVTVKTPDPSKINYIYDWNSIFATPSQASLMPSPYGPMNTVAPQQKQGGIMGQAANDAYGAPYKMAVGGFAEGGIVSGNNIEVGDGGSVDDLINILKGNSG